MGRQITGPARAQGSVKGQSRVSAGAIVAGLVVYQVATLFHASGPDLNDNAAIFREYADSDGWIAVHLLQLAGILLVLGGLVGLVVAWQGPAPRPSTLTALVFAAAAASAALVAALQGVDGVALKRAVDDWVSAPPAERADAFGVAEGIRWAEYALSAVSSMLLGATAALAAVLSLRGPLPAWLGWAGLAAAAGLVAQGVLIAYEGFSDAQEGVGFVATTSADPLAAGDVVIRVARPRRPTFAHRGVTSTQPRREPRSAVEERSKG